MFNGNPETANSIYANSYKSISRISKINAFLYTAFIIVSYLSVNDIKNASYYFTYYNKLDMTGLKTVYYEIHQLGHKIFNILLSNSQSDPHLLIGLYNELLIKLNAHYLVCVEKLIHWQLANIYINENNTAQAVFHLKEIVCDDNSLAITKLAKKSLNNMNVEFSVELAKEFKPFFIPIPFFIYLIILLGILLPLFYIVDIFL